MKRYVSFAVFAAVSLVSAGCIEFSRNAGSLTAPSGTELAVSTLAGTYRSINSIPSPDSCTNFSWSVTEKTANSARGNFSASCQNNTLQVAGTAQGTQTGQNIAFQVNATATSAGVSCAISISGTEILKRD